jgi:hypothetical protein
MGVPAELKHYSSTSHGSWATLVLLVSQYRNNTITREVTDVPATDSVQLGIKHTTGLIYNAKQDWRSMWLFKPYRPTAAAMPAHIT